MRKLLLLAFLIGFQFFTFAQAPEGFTYQSVVRDASGQLFAGRVVGMRISILQNSASGIAVYTETHNANTNTNGLLTLEIGTGSSSNNFATIDWSDGPYFIQAEVSLANDGNYTISSTSQLLSVPYALHAKTAESVLNTPAETDPIFTNSVAAAINANDTAAWNVDNDAFNELQILSINNDTIFLTNSGFILLPETFSGNYGDLNNKPNFPDSVNAYGFDGNYNSLTNAPNLSDVATSGNYIDLNNKPNFPDSVNAYGFDGNYNSLSNAPNLSNVATSGNYSDLNNKPNFLDSINAYGFDGNYNTLTNTPNLSHVATSGNFNDLNNKPNFPDSVNAYGFDGNYNSLTNAPNLSHVATSGNYIELNNKPNFPDSVNAYGFDGNYNSLSNAPNLSIVATSGNYDDLSNKPNFPDSVNVYGFDGNYNSLSNAPNLSGVAISGNYNDLNNKPNFPDSVNAYGFNGNYNSLTNAPNLSNVATSGDYNDLINVPVNLSAFNNDENFIIEEKDSLFINSLAYEIKSADTMRWNNKQNKLIGNTGVKISGDTISLEMIQNNYQIGANDLLGGILIWISNSGKHGLVVANKDQGLSNYLSAPLQVNNPNLHDSVGAEFRDWRLPTKQELELVYQNKSLFTGLVDNPQNNPYYFIIGMHFDMSYGNKFEGRMFSMEDGFQGFAEVNRSGRIRAVRTVDFSNNLFANDYNQILNKPNLANVAISGDYNDLTNKPNLSAVNTDNQQLSVSATGDTLHLQNGGFVIIPGISAANAPAGSYPPGTVHCLATPTAVVDVTNPSTGKTWMDRNLGATQVATSITDAAAYGDLYQWGRGADGHQCRNSATTTTSSSTDTPAHGSFILTSNAPLDWRSPQNTNLWQGVNGVNNPCPSGYRLPTETELNAERTSWSSNNAAGAFASPLKLPMAGGRSRSSGSLGGVGTYGDYWSSTVSSANSRGLYFVSSDALMGTDHRAFGYSVRCIKD